jgi:D-alanyl-D-alanine carboxypeptidase
MYKISNCRVNDWRLTMKQTIGICLSVICLIVIVGCSTTREVLKQAEAYDSLPAQDRLEKALEAAVDHPKTEFPGAAVYVSSAKGTWRAAAGVSDLNTGSPLSPDERFRAGSIMKSFVAAVVLQLIEEGKFSLDSTLPEVLPESVYGRFEYGSTITVRQLMSHTSGIPDWDTPDVDKYIGENPKKVWTTEEYLDLAASHPTNFPPGEGYAYSNTNYNLLGVMIENATGKEWREEIENRILAPLDLTATVLPRPGTTEIPDRHARGYERIPGKRELVDMTEVDPSMAGAAGGAALMTTLEDLGKYFHALYTGELFAERQTLDSALEFVAASDFPGHDGYGLGIMHMDFDGIELIGHLGGTAGYIALSGYMPDYDAQFSVFISAGGDPSPAFFPAIIIAADALH